MNLTQSQILALEYFKNCAVSRKDSAEKTIRHILKMSDIIFDTFEYALTQLKTHTAIALHFHPDRMDGQMKTVAQSLLESGMYKNQFDTQISNGSVSAYSGGARDNWEKLIFGEAYHKTTSPFSQRPKYGALDLMRHPDGPAPRFGSCYFILKPEVSERSTFTYLDSHQNPDEKGTIDEFNDIMATLLSEVFTRDFALGESNLNPSGLIAHLSENLSKPYENPFGKKVKRNLNHYIEAQIHGDIYLKEHVEILVGDPSFKNTIIGKLFETICEKYEIELFWHSGFAMKVDDVPCNFRGNTMPSLAKRITEKSYFDVNMIGLANQSLIRNPENWKDRGNFDEVLQELKLLWHVLVKYGKPLSNFIT